MASRGRMMVALALNQELAAKVKQINNVKKNLRAPANSETDPDYIPSEDDETNETSTTKKLQTDCDCADNVVQDVVQNMIDKVVEEAELQLYTKKGELRKRKTFAQPLNERKKMKKLGDIAVHGVKSPCKPTCKFKCPQNIDHQRQKYINTKFWSMAETEKKEFAMKCMEKVTKKKCTTKTEISRREHTFSYTLPSETGEDITVCKTFLLSTLGYGPSNDSILKFVRKSVIKGEIVPLKDKRGSHPNSSKIDRDLLKTHILSFRPTISHYRREHAPNRLYLPSDINASLMYTDFKKKHPDFKLSYDLYRKEVVAMNISFAKLGNEECYQCEQFDVHCQKTNHEKNNTNIECSECADWNHHHKKYIAARMEYEVDAKKGTEEGLIVSADLQKVIMLPRAEMFKEILFIPRIIVFNESFVPVGKSRQNCPLAVIWHEGVTGRHKGDLVSTFYSFFIKNRDEKKITIWLDNCAAQNKNWTLFSFFIYIINCLEVSVENLNIKYFQSGHTFMSADSFHHQVELSMKSKGKLFDFNNFKVAVENANASKVNVCEMNIENFFEWKDYTSQFKLKKIIPRVYLRDIVHVQFTRGKHILKYKKAFDEEEFKELDFLKSNAKKLIPKPKPKSQFRGICKNRKENLIKMLKSIAPENRLSFWNSIPVSQTHQSDNDDSDGSVSD